MGLRKAKSLSLFKKIGYGIMGLLLICSIIVFLHLNISPVKSDLLIPVKGVTRNEWDVNSFWHYPWGESITHKGIDIFGADNAEVITPEDGIIIESGYNGRGGNYLYILGSRSRVYYFAHLSSIRIEAFSRVRRGQVIGYVGNTGNASSKPPHLHFSIYSIVPIVKFYEKDVPQGWKKMNYLDPDKYFNY